MTDRARPAAGRPSERDRDEGQAAALLILVVVALAAATMSGIGHLGAIVRDRVHAQSVADAAALASLDGGRGRAVAVSAAHGATLLSWSDGPGQGEVTVEVRVGSFAATARASDAP